MSKTWQLYSKWRQLFSCVAAGGEDSKSRCNCCRLVTTAEPNVQSTYLILDIQPQIANPQNAALLAHTTAIHHDATCCMGLQPLMIS